MASINSCENIISFENIKCSINNNDILHIDSFNISKSDKIIIIAGCCCSGKTTLLNLIYNPNIFTSNNWKLTGKLDYHNSHIKMIPHLPIIHPYLTVNEILQIYITSYNLDNTVDYYLDEFNLTSIKDKYIGDHDNKSLSTGQLVMLNILLNTLNKPDLLILDEPFSNLDILSSVSIIRILNEIDIPILISLHQPNNLILEYVNKLIIIDKGKVTVNQYLGDIPDRMKYYEKYFIDKKTNTETKINETFVDIEKNIETNTETNTETKINETFVDIEKNIETNTETNTETKINETFVDIETNTETNTETNIETNTGTNEILNYVDYIQPVSIYNQLKNSFIFAYKFIFSDKLIIKSILTTFFIIFIYLIFIYGLNYKTNYILLINLLSSLISGSLPIAFPFYFSYDKIVRYSNYYSSCNITNKKMIVLYYIIIAILFCFIYSLNIIFIMSYTNDNNYGMFTSVLSILNINILYNCLFVFSILYLFESWVITNQICLIYFLTSALNNGTISNSLFKYIFVSNYTLNILSVKLQEIFDYPLTTDNKPIYTIYNYSENISYYYLYIGLLFLLPILFLSIKKSNHMFLT